MPKRLQGLPISSEERVMGALLLLVPLTLWAANAGWPSWLQFFLSVGAIVPLAAFIGWATEALADRFGGKLGGLLNATFGNAPDLLVGVFGVQKGLFPLVKATLIGALISNSALIMGSCCLVAGLVHGRPRFRREEAGHHSVLMLLTLAAVVFPSVGAFAPCPSAGCGDLEPALLQSSVGIAVALLLAYGAYVVYAILGWESLRRPKPIGKADRALEPAGEVDRGLKAEAAAAGRGAWPLWLSIGMLLGSAIALVPITDVLTGSVAPVTEVLGWTQVFVGMVIVANAGNVAEAYAALTLAVRRPGAPSAAPTGDSGLDLALGIASASSIQIATFVLPLVVLYSLTTHPMSLVFGPVEIAILALLVMIFNYIAHDGESNWLEGAQLLALYAMAAILFYALPEWAFGG